MYLHSTAFLLQARSFRFEVVSLPLVITTSNPCRILISLPAACCYVSIQIKAEQSYSHPFSSWYWRMLSWKYSHCGQCFTRMLTGWGLLGDSQSSKRLSGSRFIVQDVLMGVTYGEVSKFECWALLELPTKDKAYMCWVVAGRCSLIKIHNVKTSSPMQPPPYP